MTKWLCGTWFQRNAPPVTEECFQRAVDNLNRFNFVFLSQFLSTDLPLSARLLGVKATEDFESVRKNFIIGSLFNFI